MIKLSALLLANLLVSTMATASFSFELAQPIPNDPFIPYLTNQAPPILRDLETGKSPVPGVKVRRVVFASRTVATEAGPINSEIYAFIAWPEAPGKYPGIEVLHGGTGSAQEEEEKAVAWAKRGYVAIAPDLPGIGEPKKLIHSNGWWKALNYGKGHWNATPDASASTIFDGQIAALQAFYLLKSHPNVDTDKLGIVGISWGGYTTTMLSGLLGNDVKAAFSVYGSGFYELTGHLAKSSPENRKRWLQYLDAGRRTSGIKAPFFIAAATNDFFFWPPSVSATLASIPGENNQLFSPNASHKAPVPGGTSRSNTKNWLAMEVPYFDYFLKGEGLPLPKVKIIPKANGERATIRFMVEAPVPLQKVEVYYSRTSSPWMSRQWIPLAAEKQEDGSYTAHLSENITHGVDWFALVSDERPMTVSSPIQRIEPH